MRTVRRGVWLVILLAVSSCAINVKSQKLEVGAAPVRDIEVAVWMGDLSSVTVASLGEQTFYRQTMRKALSSRVPKIFEANAVPILAMSIQETSSPPAKVRALLDKTKASHVLAITPKSVGYRTRYGARDSILGVTFEAKLWEVATSKTVWQATPSLPIAENQPLLKSQQFAAMLLVGLHRDGLIKLQHGFPVDLEGKEITDYWGSAPDK